MSLPISAHPQVTITDFPSSDHAKVGIWLISFIGPSGFPVGTPKMLCLTPWKSTESAYGSSHGHLTTVLAAVKGSLAWLGGFAALDACCAPWCTAAMR